MRVAIDIDGVLRDFTNAVKTVYLGEFPHHKVEEITEWGIHKFYPIGEGIYDFVFKLHAEEIFTKAQAYRGAAAFMRVLKARKHEVWVVTSQPMGQEPFTLQWLRDNGIVYDSIAFTVNKPVVDCDIFLDDGTHNLTAIRDAGKFAVAFDRPWNSGWTGLRVKSYKGFTDLLKGGV